MNSSSTQTQVEFKLSSSSIQVELRHGSMRAEPQAEWKSPQAWERFSTSLGAILHKPDLPGPPTRHASSRRLFRLPTRLFRLPPPTFSLRQLQNLVKAAASSMPPYQNCTYFRETGRAVSMKPPMPRQVLQLPRRDWSST